MAIRLEAKIKPSVTRMARIPRLHPNNDPNVDPNWEEYGRMRQNATKLPEFATELMGFGQIWTRKIAELKKT